MASIRKFIFHDLRTIDGYIDPPDALVFLSILESQRQRDLKGGIAEIGVFFGRSYFLIKKIAAPEEKVLAIDLFDLGNQSDGVPTQYQQFIDNGTRLGLTVDEDLVIVGDSTKLAANDIVDKVGELRFFSIDGGHMLSHVTADSHLAEGSLAKHGVIAFDDTFNPAWPEVTVGVADFLRESQQYSAFCMTKYKTYVCRNEFHADYLAAIADAPHLQAFDHVETEFLGAKVVRLHDPLPRRILHEIVNRLGLSAFSERVYR
ncbi:class I SAM-dependent methyltransferase [Rhizobium tubonense]|uniref:Class I SAM-dependent methyltransferase n=1 Tax=Rhizobium tubonense TaxID=484088 RepID=A0A2W4C8H4_9HYPH|nr:class I SAM-dependent methyltransferase [Rhizobium tubonense]PZM09722.1 hypothetical protein CPY51_25975 [Rhizobium tubonense]